MGSKEDMELFISETEDLIQKTEDEILKIEENPNDSSPIQELFYTFHTLKGIIAMAGFDNASKFCHHIETTLDNAKKNKISANKIGDFINVLLESLDMLRTLLNRVKKGDMTDIDNKFLIEVKESFEVLESTNDIVFIKPITSSKIDQIIAKRGAHFYKIYILIQTTCVFKKVRLFIIFRALNEIGQICSSNPVPEVLESGKFNLDFELYYISSKSPSEITQILEEILEIENKVITKLDPKDFKKIVSDLSATGKKVKQKALEEVSYEEEIIDGKVKDVSRIVDGFKDTSSKISSIKVNIEVLERLMNYFGELVITKNQINQKLVEKEDKKLKNFLDNMDKPFLDIQELLFRLKLIRVESTFNKYKRLVRDVARETGKKLKFILEGMDVEIDRKILEELNSPLVHLLRNAIYHGIEKSQERKIKNKDEIGILELKTYRSGGSIFIEVSDDGKGIDYDKIREIVIKKGLYSREEAMQLPKEVLNQLILLPNFTTLIDANMISGRGMGLAIVAENIKKLGGSLSIQSKKDIGTKFTLIVPFTRAILKAQLIKVSGDLFAIPTEHIEQIYIFNPSLVEYEGDELYYKLNSHLVQIIQMEQYLDLVNQNYESSKSNSHSKIAILCKISEENGVIFVVDEILHQMDIVVKPFKSDYADSQGFLGSTITGDGSICLVLDVLNILSLKIRENDFFNLIN